MYVYTSQGKVYLLLYERDREYNEDLLKNIAFFLSIETDINKHG